MQKSTVAQAQFLFRFVSFHFRFHSGFYNMPTYLARINTPTISVVAMHTLFVQYDMYIHAWLIGTRVYNQLHIDPSILHNIKILQDALLKN